MPARSQPLATEGSAAPERESNGPGTLDPGEPGLGPTPLVGLLGLLASRPLGGPIAPSPGPSDADLGVSISGRVGDCRTPCLPPRPFCWPRGGDRRGDSGAPGMSLASGGSGVGATVCLGGGSRFP